MNYWTFIAGFCFIGFSACSQAGNYSLLCPSEINTTEQIQNVPKGWESLNKKTHHYLSSVTFYSDHPNEMASLKPDFINKKKAKWGFSIQEIIYITCQYNQTGIEVTQPLPKKTTGCMVSFNQNMISDRGYLPEKIECTN